MASKNFLGIFSDSAILDDSKKLSLDLECSVMQIRALIACLHCLEIIGLAFFRVRTNIFKR